MSIVSTETRRDWEALLFSCPSDNLTRSALPQFAVLLRTLVLCYKQADAQANLLELFAVRCSHTDSINDPEPKSSISGFGFTAA